MRFSALFSTFTGGNGAGAMPLCSTPLFTRRCAHYILSSVINWTINISSPNRNGKNEKWCFEWRGLEFLNRLPPPTPPTKMTGCERENQKTPLYFCYFPNLYYSLLDDFQSSKKKYQVAAAEHKGLNVSFKKTYRI